MTSNQIQINDYPFINLTHLIINQQVNEHGTISISGNIADTDAKDIMNQINSGDNLKITGKDSTGSIKTLFQGIVDSAQQEITNDMSLLHIQGIGNSSLLDEELKIRTFQDRNMSYKKVTDYLKKDNSNSHYLVPENSGTAIRSMFVQYNETNWEFSKRIASRLQTVVVPNNISSTPDVSIGVPAKSKNTVINTHHYAIHKNLEEFAHLKSHKVSNLNERDFIYYEFYHGELFNLCDRIVINGEERLIASVQTKLENGELIHIYSAKPKNGFKSAEFFNEQIIGASMTGVVKSINEDQVRVSLHKDVTQTRDKWFNYSTPYSSPDGTGWYFMPEQKDEIRLHFPTQIEKDSYIISSTHVTHGDRSDPETKFIRTKRGQAITFKPDSIRIEDGQGSSITMDKKRGIEVKTDKNIRLNATDNVEVSSRSKVIISGDKNVQIRQNDSLIHADDSTIDISAGHVRIQ